MIENRDNETAVTIHVYGGEMEECRVFLEGADGWYREETRALSYSG